MDRKRGDQTILKSEQEVEFARSTRAAENKTRWKEIVAKSSELSHGIDSENRIQ